MADLQVLLETTVILVAHPDDEVIGFGALMQQMTKAVVIFATDGAPRDEYFWKQYASREAYAEVRRNEACEALAIVGAEPVFLADRVPGGISDQELFRRLPSAVDAVEQVIADIQPDALLALSYEGGHPDHDSTCFIASLVGKNKGIPVWEGPLYHRHEDGTGAIQKFHRRTGEELELHVEGEAMRKKVEMFHTYKSQKLVLDVFRPEIETFRPVANYDFTKRPLPWKLNYEHWQWSMNGDDVAQAFAEYMEKTKHRGTEDAEEELGQQL